MSTTPTASPTAQAQATAAMAQEKPTAEVKYKLILREGQTEVTIGRLKVTAMDIEGPMSSTWIKAIKREDERMKANNFAKYIKQA